jgi:hypothetical protein
MRRQPKECYANWFSCSAFQSAGCRTMLQSMRILQEVYAIEAGLSLHLTQSTAIGSFTHCATNESLSFHRWTDEAGAM